MTAKMNPAVKATKKAARTTKKVAVNNPGSSIGSVGAFVALIGAVVGWDATLQAQISSAFLAAIPVVKGLQAWWAARAAAKVEAEEE